MLSSKIRVAAYTSGKLVPSARFRIRQLVKSFESRNIELSEYTAVSSIYAPAGNLVIRMLWFFQLFFFRFLQLFNGRRSDIFIFQKELIATLLTFEKLPKWMGKKTIFDVDDSIWLNSRLKSTCKIAKNVSVVVVGNEYLKDYFKRYNKNTVIIPTAVDLTKYYKIGLSKKEQNNFIIGWMGSSSGYQFFNDQILYELSLFFKDFPNAVLKVISDTPPIFKYIHESNLSFEFWSASRELEDLNSFDVGIMPIDNSIWSLGKCSYKMLLYMACELPVIVTDAGMNSEVLRLGREVGFGVPFGIPRVWRESLVHLISNPNLCEEMGKNGRYIVENNYSVPIVVDKWMEVLC
jgi:glycosyltransferase involved in cell wall biosynthesis